MRRGLETTMDNVIYIQTSGKGPALPIGKV